MFCSFIWNLTFDDCWRFNEWFSVNKWLLISLSVPNYVREWHAAVNLIFLSSNGLKTAITRPSGHSNVWLTFFDVEVPWWLFCTTWILYTDILKTSLILILEIQRILAFCILQTIMSPSLWSKHLITEVTSRFTYILLRYQKR